ncbi:hypothetical protein ATO11_11500 [Pseudaestuariivita atlantica]|uniref:YHYH domain-containing protein n=2 Tax=Pseudaestuariivita atlantica TaxID=1317121 RepID=A0A0L1JQB8_9RHOB|nr:hypothetical protein ATO11_11500 [Pseudaestuariivita atlantica]
MTAATAMTIGSASEEVSGGERCITSDATPTHQTGSFPNANSPNRVVAQSITYCVDATPDLTGRITERTNASGISVSGILFRPGTADWYDGSSPRGFSRDPSSGWRLEGMGSADALGIDAAFGHPDNRGLYHYHAASPAFLDGTEGTLIGYAADGFEIHYVGDAAQSSWRLKSGKRPTAPFGTYDGAFEQDWENVAGSGNLDQCNGAMTSAGTYAYFATDTFPFFPRCFKGTVSSDFLGRP